MGSSSLDAVSFFTRKREELVALGIDPARLPPGQYHTERFPVLHEGSVPDFDLATWDFLIDGSVVEPKRLTWGDMMNLSTSTITTDIHCVTKWTKLDTTWEGIPTRVVWDLIEPSADVTHVMVRAEHGYTTNLPVEDLLAETSMFALRYDGEPLTPEHGYPMRLVVPHLYFWKSAKWVRGLTLLTQDSPGFWERNGYHMYGDPFAEQRYWGD